MNFLCMSFYSWLLLLEAVYTKIIGWKRGGSRKMKPQDTLIWSHTSEGDGKTREKW